MAQSAFGIRALLLISALAIVNAQTSGQSTRWFFPPACQNAQGTCCPSYNGKVCGGAGVGQCGSITNYNNVCDVGVNAVQQGVNGAWWLTELFTRVCICQGNYWGADCSQCKFGWTGPTCSTPTPVRVRQAFPLLSPGDQQNVINAFIKAKTVNMPGTSVSMFNYLAGLHSFAAGAYTWNHPYVMPNSPPNYAHSQWDQYGDIYWGAGFPSWHRHFLLVVEQTLALASGNASFALPYWDWSKTAMLTNPNLDYTIQAFGGNGQPSYMMDPCLQSSSGAACGCPLKSPPFNASDGFYEIQANGQSDGSAIRRALGGTCFGGMSLPTPQQVQQIQSMTNYGPNYNNDGWSIYVEFNLHGTVHDWVGGSMMMLEWSASDPIFYMHHCFVDLLFEQWIRANNPAVPGPNVAPTSGAPYGHNLHDCLGPFFPLADHKRYFLPSTNVGYTYDILSASSTSGVHREAHLQSHTHASPSVSPSVSDTISVTIDRPNANSNANSNAQTNTQTQAGAQTSTTTQTQTQTSTPAPAPTTTTTTTTTTTRARGLGPIGIHGVVMEGARALHCYDFYKDWDEEDVDCGGADCWPC